MLCETFNSALNHHNVSIFNYKMMTLRNTIKAICLIKSVYFLLLNGLYNL